MINDAIRRGSFAGRIANPRQRSWGQLPPPSRWAYPQHRGGAGHSGPYHSAGLIGQTRWFSATMGSMSASDAAPLPRLGEVFFDVRGNSRSMRLSWYADTGVAVFSIWQGGTCTGTFRLPMDDLARMIESLQRGPQGQRAGRRRHRARQAVKRRAARRAGRALRGGAPTRARRRWPCGCRPGPARPRASARTAPARTAARTAPGGQRRTARARSGLRRGLRRIPHRPARPGLSGPGGQVPGRAVHRVVPPAGPGVRPGRGLSR